MEHIDVLQLVLQSKLCPFCNFEGRNLLDHPLSQTYFFKKDIKQFSENKNFFPLQWGRRVETLTRTMTLQNIEPFPKSSLEFLHLACVLVSNNVTQQTSCAD